MITIKGISVSAGIAIGRARILTRSKIKIDRKTIREDQVESELERFKTSVEIVIEEIDLLINSFSDNEESIEILSTHKLILQDPDFKENVSKLIKNDLISLEQSIHHHFTAVIDLFKNMKNDYFAERSSDYEDVAYRLLNHVLQRDNGVLNSLDENSIVIANNITPSGVTKVYEKKIKGICTEKGSTNSHSAIIARSMNLPFVARIPNLLNRVKNDDLIIVNGLKGEIIIDPDEETRDKFNKIHGKYLQKQEELKKLIGVPVRTLDDKEIGLMCNIEIPDEMPIISTLESEGIGLFRTEFLFIDRDELPTEDEQYNIYNNIAEAIEPHPLIIRTIDVGGDKLSKVLNLETELNPNLGCRGIRISLQHKPIFKTQIKAILRASKTKNIKIMFPMISSLEEVKEVKKIIGSCKKELDKKNIEFDKDIKIGAMIEIPSAAITSDLIAAECDFLSIGTNDLIQYTLAVDRDNQTVDKYYIPQHPSVLRLIKLTIQNAHNHNVKVAVCGEMASQMKFIPLLLGLGIDELSVSPGQFLEIKKLVLNSDINCLKKQAEEILKSTSIKDIDTALAELGKK